MDVFLSRLSYLTTQHELENAIHAILAKKLHIPLTEKAQLTRCNILGIQDENGHTECHGLIRITPDTAAQWFIKQSPHEKVHGKRLHAHRYIVRDSSWKPPYEGDKRRSSLKQTVKKPNPQFATKGIDKFRVDHS